MVRKKANRGVKGEGYFSQVGDKYLYKIPAGTYENGRTKYKAFTGNTKKEAYERGMEYRRRVGDASAFGNDPYLKDYIMWWAKVYKRDAKSVRQSTYTRLCRTITNQIIPTIGNLRLSELTVSVIQTRMVNALLNNDSPWTGKPLAPRTVEKTVIHLKDCLEQAVEDRLIRTNPCAKVKKPTAVQSPTQNEMRFFTDDEIIRFEKAAYAQTKNGFPVYKHADAFVLVLFTGMRIGEAAALTAADVDLEKRRIHIHRTSVAYYDMDDESPTFRSMVQYNSEKTKTDSGDRYVPLGEDTAYRAASSLVRRCKKNPNANLISGEENVTIPYSSLLTSYKAICRRAEIENPNGPHTLRHSFASMMIRNGADIKVLSKILGHKSASFTYDTYVHIIAEQMTGAVQGISPKRQKESKKVYRQIVQKAVAEGITQESLKTLFGVMDPELVGKFLAEAL